ncbi:Uncharacterised protein [Achromobacter ruhlandii]|nr:Uncharacterised protein [Achromobacter ruhlandii]
MRELQAGGPFEHLAGQVARRARPGRTHVAAIALRLDVGDQLGHGRGLHVGTDHQHVGHGGQQRDRREILDRVIRDARIQRRVDAVRAGGRQQQRIAVGRGRCHLLGGDGAVGAALVVDHDGLPQRLRRLGRHRAGQDVGGAAGRMRHDQRDGLGGKGLRVRGRQRRQQTGGGERRAGKAMKDHASLLGNIGIAASSRTPSCAERPAGGRSTAQSAPNCSLSGCRFSIDHFNSAAER